MSADTRPISPSRFAAALEDLSVSMLHLKVLEIRNSIAHLQYSNDQLQPFAQGTAIALGQAKAKANLEPDQDCVDAIRENEMVIERMAERIAMVRAEIEARGMSWSEFRSTEEVETEAKSKKAMIQSENQNQQHGSDGQRSEETQRVHCAWSDGTFQTGTIRNGELLMNSISRVSQTQRSTGTSGGGLNDEELRRATEERMRDLSTGEEGGLHL
ncbi:hypothetical protein E4U61_006136 [Claviceps capensis]|nr:hypothetical protein E4U61_006136 [Claviceps capensis]